MTRPEDLGFEVIDADVLVVGGGLAALRAALAAREAGARVVVAVKRKLGRSGSSANTSAGYAAAGAELDALDDPQLHYEDTVIGGASINDRKLVRALVDEGPARLRELWRMGAEFRMRDGRYQTAPSGDHRRPRIVVSINMRGTDITLPLRKKVVEAGVEILENCAIVDLLESDGKVIGAVGLGRDQARAWVIRAGATILAAGGAGRLFTVTSNPVDVCGGGYALALKAGARLRDMEFIQFYPWRLIRPFKSTRMPIQSSTFVVGGRLYNRRGERFMEAYDPVKKETATRDVSARAIFDQIRLGRSVDGGVVLDISDVPDDEFRFQNTKVIERLEPRGIDYRQIPLIIAPEAHFFMGGVVIDDTGATSLAGLYAAGENAGGTHGGNRLNSNAVPETQVLGHRAGTAAAAHGGPQGKVDDRVIAAWDRRLAAVRSDATDASAAMDDLLAQLQERMWFGVGIVRTADGLGAAMADAAQIRERAAAAAQETVGDLVAAIELADLCDVGAAIAASALARTESRAAHYREDFPAPDAGWLQTVLYAAGRTSLRPVEHDPEEDRRLVAPPAGAASPREHVE